MAKEMRVRHASPNSVVTSRSAGLFRRTGCPTAAASFQRRALLSSDFFDFQSERPGHGLGLLAKDMRTTCISKLNHRHIPVGWILQQNNNVCRPPVRRPFVFPNPAARDVGMEFGDLGCTCICFAIISNLFPAHYN